MKSDRANYPDKWEAAQAAFRAALSQLPEAERGAARLAMIRNAVPFRVTYADGATEYWPLNPNGFGTALLNEEPVPGSLSAPNPNSKPPEECSNA